MPNIAITKYCNLNCPYCFASEMLDEKNDKNITLKQLDKILNWLSINFDKNEHIGIIGGEPTLHPQFLEILNKINEFTENFNSHCVLFTNGINLINFLPFIGKNTSILINVNNLEFKLKEQLLTSLYLIDSLNWFDIKQQKVTLGCNLYLEEEKYKYFWDIVDLFPSIKQIRISVTAPIEKSLQKSKEQYYIRMRPIFWNFLLEAKKRHLNITYDCNQIPLCLFSEDQKNFILSFGEYKNCCGPVIDITPEFYASSCFGTYHETLIDCSNFNNLNELKKFFSFKIMEKTFQNKQEFCTQCNKIDFLQCQGGCLSFV